MIWAREAQDKTLKSEPAWVAIAHALLTYGPATTGLPPADFWRRVIGVDGKRRTAETLAGTVSKSEAGGLMLQKDPLRFGPGMGYVLGISIGGESMRAALFDANGELVSTAAPTNMGPGPQASRRYHAAEASPELEQLVFGPEAMMRRLGDLARAVITRAASDEKVLVAGKLPLLGVCVGWPTPLNRWTKLPTGTSLQDRAWRHEVLKRPARSVEELVAEELGIPSGRSFAINDANALALGAAFDRCRESAASDVEQQLGSVILALRLGAGVGAGIAVIGSPPECLPRSRFLYTWLIEGTGGYAGELGHWQVPAADLEEIETESDAVDPRTQKTIAFPDPRRCGCGNERCLSSYASAKAFVARMEAAGISIPGLPPDSERRETSTIHEALRNATDPAHLAAQEDAGRLIGRSLAAPMLMLNPERIVLAGSFALNHVKDGIEHERRLWRHVWRNSEAPDVELKPITGIENRYSVARGAALATFRGQLFRRLDDGINPRAQTLELTAESIEAWHERKTTVLA